MENSPEPPPVKPGFWKKLLKLLEDSVLEFVGSALTIASIAGTHWLVEWLWGKDVMAFDLFPLRYAFDVAHLVTITVFVCQIVQKWWDDD